MQLNRCDQGSNYTNQCSGVRAILVLTALLASGCGDKFQRLELGFTEVHLSNGNVQALNLTQAWLEQGATAEAGDAFTESFTYDGMIYAINQEAPGIRGRKYLPTMAAGSGLNWVLPNGTWAFYVAGYDASLMFRSGSSTGACGSSGPVVLSGGSQTVAVSTTPAACYASPFGPSAVAEFNIHFCSAATNLSTADSTTTSCSALAPPVGGASSSVVSAKIAIYELNEFGGPAPYVTDGPGLSSGCMNLPTSAPFGVIRPRSASSGYVPPLGVTSSLPGAAFRAEVVTYGVVNCPAGSEQRIHVFRDGISAAGTSTGSMFTISGGTTAESSANAKWSFNSGTGSLFIKD